MTTQIHLVRHGHHALLERVLCGRMPGVELDQKGCRQMAAVAGSMRQIGAWTLQSSPQRRALQSAGILAARCRLALEIAPAMDEIEMGAWTGANFSDLASDRDWQRWNNRRGSARPPGGESMRELQVRVVNHLEQLRSVGGAIIIVSHAEPIRAALMHYLGIPLDRFHSVAVNPASVSTILLDSRMVRVSRVNSEVTA